ncbi:Serine/threonine-protein kinase/endoribonuclease IRE1 [Nakaseomyces bracarensis]|uniref:non-specific serine/threonine protein kinase n=1 Tax=Nakaseomyces bracarensis TaxID=273131 RepID=A0ABR4NTZ7_9SACH
MPRLKHITIIGISILLLLPNLSLSFNIGQLLHKKAVPQKNSEVQVSAVPTLSSSAYNHEIEIEIINPEESIDYHGEYFYRPKKHNRDIDYEINEENEGEKNAVRTKIHDSEKKGRYSISPTLLMADVEGGLHGINRDSGEILWTIPSTNFPPFLKIESSNPTDKRESFIIEPFDDGSIYYFSSTNGIQKLPINVKQLAFSSPIHLKMHMKDESTGKTTVDERIYISSRRSIMYKIDINSGKVISKFGFDMGPGGQEFTETEFINTKYSPDKPEQSVILTKTTYEIKIFTTSGSSYNITYSAWEENSKQNENPFFQKAKDPLNNITYIPLTDKSVIARNEAEMSIKWRIKLPNVAIGIFETMRDTTTGENILIQYPLGDVPIPKSDRLRNSVYLNYIHQDTWFALSGENYPSLVGSATLSTFEQSEGQTNEISLNVVGVHLFEDSKINLFYEGYEGYDGNRKLALPSADEAFLLDPPQRYLGNITESGEISKNIYDPNYLEQYKNKIRNELREEMLFGLPTNNFLKFSLIIILLLTVMVGIFIKNILPYFKSSISVDNSVNSITTSPSFENSNFTSKELPVSNGDVNDDLSDASNPATIEKRKRKRGSRGGKRVKKNSMNPNIDSELHNRVLKVSDKILGYGSSGTVVFEGKFQERKVAVKRMLVDFYDIASREISLLSESDEHPNVVRYYCSEETSKFLYIALELCDSNLQDIIESNKTVRYDQKLTDYQMLDILYQVGLGISHLHSLNIIHRDIKPPNILILRSKKYTHKHSFENEDSKNKILLSDFGLCKKLDFEQSSFKTNIKNAAGTTGWMAPELLIESDDNNSQESPNPLNKQDNDPAVFVDPYTKRRLTKSIDIFSLGCVFYFVLSGGKHPFGEKYMREYNIINNKKDLKGLKENMKDRSLIYEAVNLLNKMLNQIPEKRPTAEDVLKHPLCWSRAKKLEFLLRVSDRLEIETKDPPSDIILKLENHAKRIIPHHDWCKFLDDQFLDNLTKYRKYQKDKVIDLLRAIRNVYHHFNDLPEEVKLKMGTLPNGFYDYFSEKFPHLLMEVYNVVNRTMREESAFSDYF